MAFTPINGNFFRMKIDSTVISLETGFSFEYSAEEVQVGSKDGDYVIDGRKVSAININALYDKAAEATNQFVAIAQKVQGGTLVAWNFAGTSVGDPLISGTGTFTQTNLDSQTGQAVTWTARLSVNAGTINFTGTVSA